MIIFTNYFARNGILVFNSSHYDRQLLKIFKTLNDRQYEISDKPKEIEGTIQTMLCYLNDSEELCTEILNPTLGLHWAHWA